MHKPERKLDRDRGHGWNRNLPWQRAIPLLRIAGQIARPAASRVPAWRDNSSGV